MVTGSRYRTMRIIAKIVKTESGQYLFNGKLYDSILNARRELNRFRRPRLNQQSEFRYTPQTP